MTSPLPRGATPSRVVRLAAAGLAALLVLSACSDGDDESKADSSAEASETVSAYPEAPEGVELTEPGSELTLGEPAVVAWEPRADTTGALSLTPQSFEKATMKAFAGWKLDETTKRSTPYYVHVSVENVGETDLGGVPVPLYIVDASDTLIQQSTFQSEFAPCSSTTLPEKFPAGATAEMCLVYLAPFRGVLQAASFRPTQAFDPITWIGDVTDAEAPAKGRKGAKKAGNQGDKGRKKG
ncbi:hypothetical protein [Nocardioides pacificus]